MNADVDPEDYCDFGSNWIYQTLSSLSMGTKVGSKAIWPKLTEANKPKFAAFKKWIEFRNWLVASSVLPAWKVEKGFVVLQMPSMTKSIRPEKFEYFYDTGKRWFTSLALRDSQQSIELFMGPVIADCS